MFNPRHLVDVDSVRLADVIREETVGRMFVRVRLVGDHLHLSFFDSEWVRNRIPHDTAGVAQGQKPAVLTTGTREVQRLVARFAREPMAYDGTELVHRRSH